MVQRSPYARNDVRGEAKLPGGVVVGKDGGVAGAGGEEMLDGGKRGDAAAGADGGAVERSGGACEVELLLQGPALEKRVDEAGVKEVSSAGGVHGVHMKRGRVVELRAVPGEYAVDAESGCGEAAAEAAVDHGQRVVQIIGCGEFAGNVAAGDEVVHVGQKRFDAGIEFVEVGYDGNAGGARPSGGLGGSGGVVAVEMKCPRVDDPVAVELFGAQREAMVAAPQDGALAGVVDKNERLLAGAIGRGEKMCLDAEARKFRGVQRGSAVSADFADVARAKSPLLAGNDSSGSLSAGENGGGANFDFGAARGIVRDGDQRVGGVQADADDVDGL
ncbi:MAG TPA: hypothetical protein VJN92_08740 [Candidatus Acidoferrum sp.]|nr:hypothetical protein [Candidatus Acidoferrum sp.]